MKTRAHVGVSVNDDLPPPPPPPPLYVPRIGQRYSPALYSAIHSLNASLNSLRMCSGLPPALGRMGWTHPPVRAVSAVEEVYAVRPGNPTPG